MKNRPLESYEKQILDCPWCGSVTRLEFHNGAYRCRACKRNLVDCCDGEMADADSRLIEARGRESGVSGAQVSKETDSSLCGDPRESFLKETLKNPVVIIESPYAGDVEANVRYAEAAMLDSLERGESPFLSHLLYPRVLDDADPRQRARGLEAASRFYARVDLVVCYADRGVSPGMQHGLALARRAGVSSEYRFIEGEDATPVAI